MSAGDRRRVRQDKSRPLVVAFKAWLEQQLARISKQGEDRRRSVSLNHWDGLTRFLWPYRTRDQHRHIVERGICPQRPQSQGRTLRRPRSQRGELGLHRLAMEPASYPASIRKLISPTPTC